MQTDSHARGVLGEIRAEQLLESKGFAILARNYRVPGAEIDLILQNERLVVFAEIKLRKSGEAGRCAVTPAKQKRISMAALSYMAKNGLMNRQARFDVIEIQGDRVTHIENAFPYSGPAF